MNLKRLLRIMEIRRKEKKKKKNGFRDGPPIDKMVHVDSSDERTFVVTK